MILYYNLRSRQATEWVLMYQSLHFFEPLDIEDMRMNTLSEIRYTFFFKLAIFSYLILPT